MQQAEATQQIDNARTRVTRFRLAPGATTGFHRHEYDYVIVPITSGTLLLKDAAGERTADLEAGTPYFREAGVEHEVLNGGEAEMVFIEVELVA